MIYFLYRSYNPGTAATNRSIAYLREIDKMGVAVTVVYFQANRNRDYVLEHFRNIEFNYCWERFKTNNYFLKYIIYFFNVLLFLNKLNDGDIVYLYEVEDLIYLLTAKKGVKVFLEKTECPDVLIGDTRLHKLSVEKYIEEVKRCDGIIVISSNLRDYFINKGVDDNKIHIINMIVDATRFNGVEKDNSVERSIVYCGSGMNTKDGLDDLIKSFKIVADKYKDVKLYIIGEKPDGEILNSPMKLVKDYGINDRVVFTGTKRPEEMPQILVNATLLALARPDNLQAKYGFPTKLGEYLLSSNPVVITSVGNISDFLTDKVDALIVPPNNPEAFAERIAWVLENSAESERIGKNGKVVAMNSFNASIESKKMIDVILNS